MREIVEIREEIDRLREEKREAESPAVFNILNTRYWALKWVLGEEE